MITHGKSKTRTYRIWMNMRNRCNRPKHHNYKYYGAIGIKVCKEWDGSFEKFFEDMGECPEGKSIERVDVQKGYSKENCVWASLVTQQNNKRNTPFLTANGKTQSRSDWARELGVPPARIIMRLKRGMNHHDALFLPEDSFVKGSRKTHISNRAFTDDEVRFIRNSALSCVEMGKMFGVNPDTVSKAKRRITYHAVADNVLDLSN